MEKRTVVDGCYWLLNCCSLVQNADDDDNDFGEPSISSSDS